MNRAGLIRSFFGLIVVALGSTFTVSSAHAQFVENVKIVHEIHGEAAGDQFGWIARRIGDVDGDGIADFTASAPTNKRNGQGAGAVYMYSGKTGKLLWKVYGKRGAQLGLGLDLAGDVNADGIGDVGAGAPGINTAYVYSGKDGSVLIAKNSKINGEFYGRCVVSAGDVNGDGHGDIIVTAPRNNAKGRFTGRAELLSGKDAAVLHKFQGEKAGDLFGTVANGGTGSNFSFVIIGSPGAGSGKRGRVFVFDGRTGKKLFGFEAEKTGAQFGYMFLSVLGDWNKDGTPDIYATDWADAAKGQQTGRAYVFSGKDGKQLFSKVGEKAGDGFGIGNGDAGDVNGDGHDDLIIGAWQHSSVAKGAGKCYLYSGKDNSLLQTYTCKVAGDTFGFDTTNVGDVDGDGSIDFLITSAYSGVKGTKRGRIFVISSKVK